MLLIVSHETDCCGARVSLSDYLILNTNTVETQLSNLRLSNVPFYPTCYVIRTLLHLSTFILQHLFYQKSIQNGIYFTHHHVHMSQFSLPMFMYIHRLLSSCMLCLFLAAALVCWRKVSKRSDILLTCLSHDEEKIGCFHGTITKASQRCTRIGVGHISVGDCKSRRSETEKCCSARASDKVQKRRKKDNENVDMKRWDKVCFCVSHNQEGKAHQ